MTAANLSFACSCGTIRGEVRGASARTGTHAQCFCTSCRAGELQSGAADPAPDPVGVFQTTPDRLRIDHGAHRIAVFSFGEKNLLRWYAPCCGTALFNTPRNPRLALVGIRTARFADIGPLGPVRGQAFIPGTSGKPRHKGLAYIVWCAAKRSAVQFISGKWRNNPLIDSATGTPVAPVSVISANDRKALLSEQ